MKNKKREVKKWSLSYILHSRLFLIFCSAIIILLSISVVKELIRRAEISREIKQLEQEIAVIESNNQELNNLVDYFNSSAFQEKEVKTRLNLKASGEQVVFLPNSNKNNAADKEEAGGQKTEDAKLSNLNNPQKWLAYFFNKP